MTDASIYGFEQNSDSKRILERICLKSNNNIYGLNERRHLHQNKFISIFIHAITHHAVF